MSWPTPFDEPIELPKGRKLITLKDAATYITKLPKVEHAAPDWQAAMQELILVAERGGPTMLARIGVMQALSRQVVREFNPDRKDTHWGKRKLKRDHDRARYQYHARRADRSCKIIGEYLEPERHDAKRALNRLTTVLDTQELAGSKIGKPDDLEECPGG